jgi:hypothetical protein
MRKSLQRVLSPIRLFAPMVLVFAAPGAIAGQQASSMSLAPTPIAVTLAESSDLSKFDKQLIKVAGAHVVHADTAQVFMFGDKAHPIHVVIPAPAIDAAHVGDVVEVTGIVRRYAAKDFEKEYRWFHEADYQDVHGGDWVIVATSVRTPEGTQLVPGSTVSTMPPDATRTRPDAPRTKTDAPGTTPEVQK